MDVHRGPRIHRYRFLSTAIPFSSSRIMSSSLRNASASLGGVGRLEPRARPATSVARASAGQRRRSQPCFEEARLWERDSQNLLKNSRAEYLALKGHGFRRAESARK